MADPSFAAELLKEDVFPHLGWDTKKAAAELGVAEDYLEGYLKGENEATPEFIKKLAEKCGSTEEGWSLFAAAPNSTHTIRDPKPLTPG